MWLHILLVWETLLMRPLLSTVGILLSVLYFCVALVGTIIPKVKGTSTPTRGSGVQGNLQCDDLPSYW